MLRRFVLGVLLAPLLALVQIPAPAGAQQQWNSRAVVAFTGSGDQTVITGVAGQRIYVFGWDVSLSASAAFAWKSGASTTLAGPMTLNAYSKGPTIGPPLLITNTGDGLVINVGTSVTGGGIVWYLQQ